MKTETTYLRMKSMLMLVMALCLCSTAMADTFTVEGLRYNTLSAKTVEVVKPEEGKYTGAITIPDKVTYNEITYRVVAIGDYAFQAANNLTSVTLPLTSIERIGDRSFNDCRGLTEFTLPESITDIGEGAFYYCDNLKDLYMHSPDPTSYNPGQLAFSKIHYGSHKCTLHIPIGATAAYAADATFSGFDLVVEYDAPKTTKYDLYVAGTRVTNHNASDILEDGAASYNASKRTLTISSDIAAPEANTPCIKGSITDLIIQVDAPVTLSATDKAIHLTKSTTITGSSELTISSDDNDAKAIFLEGLDLTISDAHLSVVGNISCDNGSLTITNSTVSVKKGGIKGSSSTMVVTSSTVSASTQDGSSIIAGFGSLSLTNCHIRPLEGKYNTSDKELQDKLGNTVTTGEIRAGSGPTLFDLYIAGTRVTSENASDVLGDGAVSFFSNTLTISDDITAPDENTPCIKSDINSLTILVAAPATLSATGIAFKASRRLTITGSPKLTISTTSQEGIAISCDNYTDLTISNANLLVNGNIVMYENLNIINSTVSVKNGAFASVTFSAMNVTNSHVTGFNPNPNYSVIVGFTTLSLTDCFIKTGGTYSSTDKSLKVGSNASQNVEIVPNPTKAPHGLVFSEAEATAKVGEDFTPPTLSNPNGLTVAWSTSNYNIADVHPYTGNVTIIASGKVVITASFDGNDDFLSGCASYTLTVERGPHGLAFSETEASAKMGEPFTPPTLMNPNKLTVTWKSSDETVATVNATTGEVTLVAEGKTFISATFAGDECYQAGSVNYALTVINKNAIANGLAFSETEVMVKLGNDFTPPTFSNPNSLSVTWKSSDAKVATVDQDGHVTPLATGQTTISATFEGNKDFLSGSVSYILTVKEKAAHGLAFSETEATAKMGEAFTPPTLSNPNSLSVTWKSSDETIAAVNTSTGEVTLVAPGKTTITATFDGNEDYQAGSVSYMLTVNHKDAVANGLAFSQTEATAKIGEPFTPPALTNPNSLSVTWKSSDETAATVNASTGEVTLVAPGTTNIVATFSGSEEFMAGSVSYELTVVSQLKGDANNDGKVNADDVEAIVNYILKGTNEGLSLENADVNSDGKIDAADIVLIIDKMK